ncbi:MAG: trehalase family glycosidase [Tidjanibacter sp.]|nr:trehalase family glycosidase [Tidjanibacter sp.]
MEINEHPAMGLKTKSVWLSLCFASAAIVSCSEGDGFRTKSYGWSGDRIVQGNYTATALSPDKIVSTYANPQNPYRSPVIDFRFCINALDGEMASGSDHLFVAETPEHNLTPVITFAERSCTGDRDKESFMTVNMPMTFRVDLSEVIDSFEQRGYYVDSFGRRIGRDEFKGVWIAGSCPPLTWDFDELPSRDDLKMTTDDGRIYTIRLMMNPYEERPVVEKVWERSLDLSNYARYKAPTLLEEALYNMALEESIRAVEPDSTLRTGKEWAGVWTRDVSYSTILAMSHIQTEAAKKSLMRKVDPLGRIIQDTGTGGSYPCSSDRIVWAVAAWEIYLVTGDSEWLSTIYPIIRRTVEQDLAVVYDSSTGLMRGEQSFLDWREQEYPQWATPTDIALSETLGTNALFCRATAILSQMCSIYGDRAAAQRFAAVSSGIAQGINSYLWSADRGLYGEYLYGRRTLMAADRSETLGSALAVLWDIASPQQAEQIVANHPQTDFGTPCFSPQIPQIPPYHNNAIWPFVQSFWLRASAKAANQRSVMHSIASIYRAEAMFLTNKENMCAQTGDWTETQINSSNMLWSLSGSLSIVYNTLFGIRFCADGLHFEPFVPKAMGGERSLKGFAYRNAKFDITVLGYGNRIESFTIDGNQTNPMVAADTKGEHSIVIRLNNSLPWSDINLTDVAFAPQTPRAVAVENVLQWEKVSGAKSYTVLCNSMPICHTVDTCFIMDREGEWQVMALDASRMASFASCPVEQRSSVSIVDLDGVAPLSQSPYKGFVGGGYIELSKQKNTTIEIPVTIERDGEYAVDFIAANANGPTNTDNRCAMRTLLLDGRRLGVCIFSQWGNDAYDIWRPTNSFEVSLSKGVHTFTLSLRPENENMNIAVNSAALDCIRITEL